MVAIVSIVGEFAGELWREEVHKSKTIGDAVFCSSDGNGQAQDWEHVLERRSVLAGTVQSLLKQIGIPFLKYERFLNSVGGIESWIEEQQTGLDKLVVVQQRQWIKLSCHFHQRQLGKVE